LAAALMVAVLLAGRSSLHAQTTRPADRPPAVVRLLERWEQVDQNHSGTLERAELPPAIAQRLSLMDSDHNGILSRAEAEETTRQRPARRMSARMRILSDGETMAPPAQNERQATKLRVGDVAPDFALPKAAGDGEIRLSTLKDKPVVLVFGSMSCPPYRDRLPEVQALYEKFKDKAGFVMVYIREAHPDSIVRVEQDGKQILRQLFQTDSMALRTEYAQVCAQTFKVTFPAVVDKHDNAVNAAYAGWPSRLVVVGTDGKIAFDGGDGPGGFQPPALEAWLTANLK
jgi:hypothetical protein